MMKSIMRCAVVLLVTGVLPVHAAEAPKPVTAPNQVAIKDYMFEPMALTVAAGTKVTWVNHDDIPHTIVQSAVNKDFRSGALDTNDSYNFTFTKPGTYKYFCTLHPQMVGTIVVTP